MANAFAGIGEADVSKGGVYVLPGVYKCRINRVVSKDSRQSGTGFIVELNILESDNPDRPVGTDMSWTTWNKFESFLGNVKRCICQLTGEEEKNIDEESVVDVLADDQPLAGMEVIVKGVNTKTRAGKDFCVVDFEPC